MVIVIFVISIAILAIIISVHQKHKKVKEELARQRQIKLEAERKKRLAEQNILKGKNRILMSPTYADYIAVEEKICDIELKIRGLRSQNSKLNLFSYHCPDSWTHWYFLPL